MTYEYEEARLDEEALQYVLADPRGQWFLARLLDICGVNTGSFSPDALQMARREGMRAVGLHYQYELVKDADHIKQKQRMEQHYMYEKMRLEMLTGGKKDERTV